MHPKPVTLVASLRIPCHVCRKPTSYRRSMTHLDGPPTIATDLVPICGECDEDWTKAVFISLRPQ